MLQKLLNEGIKQCVLFQKVNILHKLQFYNVLVADGKQCKKSLEILNPVNVRSSKIGDDASTYQL